MDAKDRTIFVTRGEFVLIALNGMIAAALLGGFVLRVATRFVPAFPIAVAFFATAVPLYAPLRLHKRTLGADLSPWRFLAATAVGTAVAALLEVGSTWAL